MGRSTSFRPRGKAKAQGREGLGVSKDEDPRPVWLEGREPGDSGCGAAGEVGRGGSDGSPESWCRVVQAT